MRIHRGRSANRALQPRIIARRQGDEGVVANALQLVEITRERLATQCFARRRPERQRRLSRRLLRRGRNALVKGEDLVAAFYDRDVSEERPDRVALRIALRVERGDIEPRHRR